MVRIGPGDVLLVIDVQNDFCTGSLAIPGFEAIIPVINRLAARFPHVVATQDWHPPDHVSFASRHAGKAPGDTVAVAYGDQPVHLDHCVQDSVGAALHPELRLGACEMILRKGRSRDVDSYSAFVENDRTTTTGLAAYLRARGVQRVFAAGLALYGCVTASALDAASAGFATFLVDDAAVGRPNPARDAASVAALREARVGRIVSSQID